MKTFTGVRLLAAIIIFVFLTGTVSFADPAGQDEIAVLSFPGRAPGIKAVSAILSETERGQILYGKNTTERLHIAALSKLMTILIAVESGNLSANITISKESVDAQGSALSLEVGEKYTLEELLFGIMLTSANDAANAVAEHIAGNTVNFTIKMNETAAKLMMTNTKFTNPTGLYDENQYTTAQDILLFMNYALKNPAFNRLFGIRMRPWHDKEEKTTILTSQNDLFWSYDGADGGKTGYNEKNRQTLISTVTRGNTRLISIVLDSPEESLFEDSIALFDYGFTNYKKSILVRQNEVLETVEYEGNEVKLISNEDVYYMHPTGESYVREYSTRTDLHPPIKTTSIAGTRTYLLKDDTVITVNLYPSQEIIPPEDFYTSAKKKILENKDILYLVIFLLAIEAILILVNILKLLRKLIRKIAK